MQRTIGRRWRGTRGDYTARCGHCGVDWPRSKLRRDGSGTLVCPDEGPGLDSTTLSRLNAMHAQSPPTVRPSTEGAPIDTGGKLYEEGPVGILTSGEGRASLGAAYCRAWYKPSLSSVYGAGGFHAWRNIQGVPSKGMLGGNLVQPVAALQPEDDDGAPTFAGGSSFSAGLQSVSQKVLAKGEFPYVWCVGSFSADGSMFSMANYWGTRHSDWILTLDDESLTFKAYMGYHVVTGTSSGENTFTATAELSDTGVHLFSMWADGDYIYLQVDSDDAVSAQVISEGDVYSTGVGTDLNIIAAGNGVVPGDGYTPSPHVGTLSEVVVASSNPSSAELSQIRAYFAEAYPEISL